MKKFLCVLLLLSTLVVSLASCGGGKDGDGTTPAGTTAAGTTPAGTTTAEVTTTDKWESIGAEVQALDTESKTLRLQLSNYGNAEMTARCQEYMAGPDELTTSIPTIQKYAYERNSKAIEYLGLNIVYTYQAYAWGGGSSKMNEIVGSRPSDAPDMFCHMIFDIANATLLGCFRDVWSIEGGYFDFEADGWLTEYMNEMSVTRDRAYLLGSDYFLDMLRALVVLPFNLTMMDTAADKLSSIILPAGTTLGEGEKLSDYFFQMVEDGNWTYDVLIALCEAIFQDSGTTEGADDMEDILGFATDASSGMCPSAFIYTTNITCVNESYSKEGKIELNYPVTVDKDLDDLFKKVGALIKAQGTFTTNSSNTGLGEIKKKFGEGTLLFGGGVMLGSLEDAEYANMADLFSVVPMPKYSTTQEYNTLIHNIGNAGAINVNSTKYIPLSAYLQYCAENSARVVREFQEIVMKFKVTTYNAGTDSMLSLIYDSIRSSRQKMIDDTVCEMGSGMRSHRWHGLLMSGKYANNTENLSGKWEEARNAKQEKLGELIDIWYGLKNEAPAAE